MKNNSYIYRIHSRLTKVPDYYAVNFIDSSGTSVGKCFIDTYSVRNNSLEEQANFAVNQILSEFTSLYNDPESHVHKCSSDETIQLSGESIKKLVAFITVDESITNKFGKDIQFNTPKYEVYEEPKYHYQKEITEDIEIER